MSAPAAARGLPIEIRGLTKNFGRVHAVAGLDFTVQPGRVTGFLGPNGAGKTTTLRMLLGLVSPTSGSATIAGRRYRELHDPLRHVGAVLEATSFHPSRRARSHLKMIALAGGIDFSRIDAVLELVGLSGDAKRKVGGFSMGMRQRLELAGALLGDPEVLILDEPSNGLDPQGIAWLREFLRHLAREGRTVLVSSHLLAEMAQTVDDVVIVAQGQLRAQGPLASLVANTTRSAMRVRTPEGDRLQALVHSAGVRSPARGGRRRCRRGGHPRVPGTDPGPVPDRDLRAHLGGNQSRGAVPLAHRRPRLRRHRPARRGGRARGRAHARRVNRRPPARRARPAPTCTTPNCTAPTCTAPTCTGPTAGPTAGPGTAGPGTAGPGTAGPTGTRPAPVPPAPRRRRRTVIRVSRAELLKLRTTPGPWVVLVIAVVLTALSILGSFINGGGHHGPAFVAPRSQTDLRDLVGSGYQAALLMAPILGVLCITAEYRHKVITTTLLNTPRRAVVLGGKGVASVLWAIGMGVACLALVAVMGLPWLSALHGSLSALLHQVGPVVPGLMADFALLAVFGLGIGILVRNQVAGVLLTIGGTFILEPLIYALFNHLLHTQLNWLPSPAAAAVAGGLNTGTGSDRHLLTWWAGALVLLAWGFGPAVLGYFTTFRRDVT